MPTIVPFETLAELPVNLANKYAGSNKAVFHRKPDPKSEYTPIYWDQVIEDVHSLASYMLSKGIEPIKVMSMGGWKDLKTMQIYIRKSGINIRGITKCLDLLK